MPFPKKIFWEILNRKRVLCHFLKKFSGNFLLLELNTLILQKNFWEFFGLKKDIYQYE
jgi:hypothetical protein